jgi:hypothetical protein
MPGETRPNPGATQPSLREGDDQVYSAPMSADTNATPRARRIPRRSALLFGANALTQFAIQAYLAYGFAAHVWKLPAPLPFAAPVALDVFAINLMGHAYDLRRARLRRRINVWFWLAVAIGVQVGAAEGFAVHEGWSWWGRIASLFPSIFLAASLHNLIIAAREREHLSDADPGPGWFARWRAARTLAAEIEAGRQVEAARPVEVTIRPRVVEGATAARQLTPPPVPEPDRAVPATPPRPPSRRHVEQRQATAPTGDPRRALVIARCIDGSPREDAKAVALELGVGVRTAQLWVKRERERRAAAARVTSRSVRAGDPADGSDTATANGASSDAPVPKDVPLQDRDLATVST